MKYLATALALATLAASPAFAASKHATNRTVVTPATESYAAYPAYGSNVVISQDGKYLGQDPDPSVRAELLRGSVINAD